MDVDPGLEGKEEVELEDCGDTLDLGNVASASLSEPCFLMFFLR